MSDHETGGLSLGKQTKSNTFTEYSYFPDPIIRATHSVQYLAQSIQNEHRLEVLNEIEFKEYIKLNIFQNGLGWKDVSQALIEQVFYSRNDVNRLISIITDLVSQKANIGWSTKGHTSVDVNLYCTGSEACSELVGNHDNTYIGNFIAQILDLNLDETTRIVQNW